MCVRVYVCMCICESVCFFLFCRSCAEKYAVQIYDYALVCGLVMNLHCARPSLPSKTQCFPLPLTSPAKPAERLRYSRIARRESLQNLFSCGLGSSWRRSTAFTTLRRRMNAHSTALFHNTAKRQPEIDVVPMLKVLGHLTNTCAISRRGSMRTH